MKEDIKFPKVEGIVLAVVKDVINNDEAWDVYLINQNKQLLTNVLVASKGYGLKKGEQVKTSTLRHHFDELKAQDYVKVEPIQQELFGLSNEYWISFYIERTIYDKKYVFLPESITEDNFVTIPILNKKGVMLK